MKDWKKKKKVVEQLIHDWEIAKTMIIFHKWLNQKKVEWRLRPKNRNQNIEWDLGCEHQGKIQPHTYTDIHMILPKRTIDPQPHFPLLTGSFYSSHWNTWTLECHEFWGHPWLAEWPLFHFPTPTFLWSKCSSPPGLGDIWLKGYELGPGRLSHLLPS